jgi:hypothetical protein
MEILNYLHIFDFNIIKLFLSEFPNFSIWWNKLQEGHQYYVLLYIIVFCSAAFQMSRDLKISFVSGILVFINSFYVTEMFLFASRICFFYLTDIFNNWLMVLAVPLAYVILLLTTIVLPYYVFHKITKRWTPLFP